MGSVFPRGNKLWLKYKNVAGRWINKPSQLDVGNEKDAANHFLSNAFAVR